MRLLCFANNTAYLPLAEGALCGYKLIYISIFLLRGGHQTGQVVFEGLFWLRYLCRIVCVSLSLSLSRSLSLSLSFSISPIVTVDWCCIPFPPSLQANTTNS